MMPPFVSYGLCVLVGGSAGYLLKSVLDRMCPQNSTEKKRIAALSMELQTLQEALSGVTGMIERYDQKRAERERTSPKREAGPRRSP